MRTKNRGFDSWAKFLVQVIVAGGMLIGGRQSIMASLSKMATVSSG